MHGGGREGAVALRKRERERESERASERASERVRERERERDFFRYNSLITFKLKAPDL